MLKFTSFEFKWSPMSLIILIGAKDNRANSSEKNCQWFISYLHFYASPFFFVFPFVTLTFIYSFFFFLNSSIIQVFCHLIKSWRLSDSCKLSIVIASANGIFCSQKLCSMADTVSFFVVVADFKGKDRQKKCMLHIDVSITLLKFISLSHIYAHKYIAYTDKMFM